MSEKLKQILNNFREKKVLVLGDVMLDHSIIGDVKRISPEAPVPVVNLKKEIYELGGAANTANNIVSLGGKCSLMGYVGKDLASNYLRAELENKKIGYELFPWNAPTIEKLRVFGTTQQLIRIDKEEKPASLNESNFVKRVVEKTAFADIIIISDYAKGTITKNLMDELKNLNLKIIVDPKPQNIELYKNVFLVKPNISEAEQITGIKYEGEQSVNKIGEKLLSMLNSNILITRGSDGVSIFEKGGSIHHIPTEAKQVYDVTGAGDTFLAALSLSISSGASLSEASIIANHASGVKVSKRGTATVSLKELEQKIHKQKSKIKSLNELKEHLEVLKKENKKIVFTNGCFDILHIGHTTLLQEAKSLGDVLVLGLNTDNSMRQLKGEKRPIVNETERAQVLSALECVDYITLFDELTPFNIINEVKPDVLVKGGDYTKETIVGSDIVESYGGLIKTIPLVEGRSTTKILEKLKENSDDK